MTTTTTTVLALSSLSDSLSLKTAVLKATYPDPRLYPLIGPTFLFHSILLSHLPDSCPSKQLIITILYNTRLSPEVFALAVLLLTRLPTSEYLTILQKSRSELLILTSLVIANKFLSDDVWNTKAWWYISYQIFDVATVNRAERLFLRGVNWDISRLASKGRIDVVLGLMKEAKQL